MRLKLALTGAGAILLLVLWTAGTRAQDRVPPTAQINPNFPLPVFVTNNSGTTPLPEGFVAGSRWRFTTWTSPSVLTWTAQVQRTSGAWAFMTVQREDGTSTSRWYFVPAMPGSWEPQQ